MSFVKQTQERLWSLRMDVLSYIGQVNNALTDDHLHPEGHTLARLRKDAFQSLDRLDSALADAQEQFKKARADLEEHPPAAAH